MDYQDYLRRVPKVELHCHFEGTVRASTFADLARKHGVELPTQDVDWSRRPSGPRTGCAPS